jgi:hypothetical protein
MPRLTADQWAAIRIEWEGEPTATFNGLASKHGVDNSQISRVARKEGWSKRGQIADINEAAQRRADASSDPDGTQTQRPLRSADLATRDESESLRAAVLVRMRSEWAELEGFRKAALAAMKTAHENGDKAAWSIAKMAADTALANIRALSVKQDAERKAWGLDAKSEEDIVITNPRRIEA